MTMGSYLRPLRRKLGVVTLLLACVFTAAWVRNRSVRDSVNIPTGNSSALQFISGDQCVSLVAMWSSVPDKKMASFRIYRHDEDDGIGVHAGEFMLASDPSPFWPRWFRFGVGTRTTTLMTFSLPYWTIVIPLTLLSGWLLFSKRRATLPHSIVEA